MSYLAGSRLGRYEIIGPLGKGGMGEVYRARDTQLDREVAIKVLPEHLAQDPDALKRFEREAKAVAALSHSNILTIYDVGSQQAVSFAVMELLEGETLRTAIAKGALSWRNAVEVAGAVAEGLAAAHSKGVIHRDLKPENIFLTSEGGVKILDFGLARYKPQVPQQELTSAPTESRVTEAGTIMGTVPYMSPEQVRGETVDARSDIFSFGCVLYEMIAAKCLFLGQSTSDTISAILRDDPPELPENMPPDVARVINHCLEKNPLKRFQTASDLVFALRQIGSQNVRPAARSKWTRHIATLSSIVIVLAAIIALIIGFRKQSPQTAPQQKIQSLAVLPLKNLSGDPQREYFADAMTEELITTLARISSLQVISRTSVMGYKTTEKSLREIAKELNVDAIIEGSIFPAGDRVRITAQLIEASTDKHMWAQSYDRDLKDILRLQNEVATAIADQIKAQLSPAEKAKLGGAPDVNPQAYQAFLRGIDYASRPPEEQDIRLSIEMFQRAADLDPDFMQAYVELSRAHGRMFHFFDKTTARAEASKAAADRAFQLKPGAPEAHFALGYYYYFCVRDYPKALEEFAVVQKALPNDVETLKGIAFVYRRQGKFAESLELLKKAVALDPRNYLTILELPFALIPTRAYSEAIPYYDKAISLAPDYVQAYLFKSKIYTLMGDLQKARISLEQSPGNHDQLATWFWVWLEINSRNYQAALDRLEKGSFDFFSLQQFFWAKEQLAGIIYHLMGHQKDAQASYQAAALRLEKELQKSPDDPRIYSSLAIVYAGLGKKEEAIRYGKKAVALYPVSSDALTGTWRVEDLAFVYALLGEQESATGQLDYLLSIPSEISVPLLRIDPRWDPLRSNPRFEKMLQKYTHQAS